MPLRLFDTISPRASVPPPPSDGRRRRRFAAAVLLAATLEPGAAQAHAVLLRGTPAPGGTLPAGHAEFDLQFNSRIEHAASQLQIQGTDGALHRLVLEEAPVDRLRAGADLAPGIYTLRWQVLALDGHLTRGSIDFSAVGPAPGPQAVVQP